MASATGCVRSVLVARNSRLHEAAHQAQLLGLRVPSMEEVVSAERYAMGSVDYSAKWAYCVAEAMNKGVPRQGTLTAQ